MIFIENGSLLDLIKRILKSRHKSASETSATDYSTCVEDVQRARILEEAKSSRRRRKLRAERHSASRVPTPTANHPAVDQLQMFTMLQECMKSTLEKVIEERPEIKTAAKEKSGISDGGTKDKRAEKQVGSVNQSDAANSSVTVKSNDSIKTGEGEKLRLPSAYKPLMAAHPQLSITKLTGENWTDFIEYFESVADANAWNEQDKLSCLLMSIDSKPRMYAR